MARFFYRAGVFAFAAKVGVYLFNHRLLDMLGVGDGKFLIAIGIAEANHLLAKKINTELAAGANHFAEVAGLAGGYGKMPAALQHNAGLQLRPAVYAIVGRGELALVDAAAAGADHRAKPMQH